MQIQINTDGKYVVPADDKKNARLIISQIVMDAFQELKMAIRPRAKDEFK